MLNRLLIALLALATVTCGKDGADKFIESYCDALRPCCKGPELGNGSQCELVLGSFAPSTGFDSAKGEACLAEIRAAAKQPGYCEMAGTVDSPACDGVFGGGGKKQPGETCDDDSDCASSAEGPVNCAFEFVANSSIQKCQVQIRGKANDSPCVGTVDGNETSSFGGPDRDDVPARAFVCHLADDLRCDGKTDRCVPVSPVGAACTGASDECVKAAYCDGTTDVCAARKPAGAMCAPSFDDPCVPAHRCATASRTCVAEKATGAACTEDDECASDDCTNGKCALGLAGFGLQLICGAK